MLERDLEVEHNTIYCWVHTYSPELDQRCCPSLKTTNDFWWVNETYIKVKGCWKYFYRAVDSNCKTLDFCSVPHRMPKRQNGL